MQRPVFLVVDGHPVHRSRAVRKFVEGTEGRLDLCFLPPYLPEVSPIDRVWSHAKNHRICKQAITDPEQLKRLVLSALRSLQRLTSVVRGFLHHPECRYIVADG
ncbi:transposase [Thiohalobacter sp. IOR34]|uniref:transposase n=1 Tax=Thiohalobacter sp. IOR34 TaxID=3057176 RepID=UPI00339DA7E2